MFRSVQDTNYPSSQVTPTGNQSSAFQDNGPNLEGIDASVLDSRAASSTGYGVGTLWVEAFLASNTGDANYLLGLTATQPIPMFSFGILTAVPPNPAGVAPGQPLITGLTTGGSTEIRIRQKGFAMALCTTGATAIAPGTPLVANGTGGLMPAGATPAAGTVLAIAKGTLAANTAVPTMVAVSVGGY